MITFEEAKDIGFAAIERESRAERAHGRTVNEPKFWNEQEDHWTFGAALPELQAEGFSPGAILVSVHKADGHILDDAEFEQRDRRR